jgi:FtsP/CotA-like multicopper oxidase with cupredoxin domain
MNRKFTVIMTALVFLLAVAGSAGAQAPPQTLLPGALIPKFVDPLPVAVTGVSVVDATGGNGNGTVSFTYNIHMKEFQAQILPSTGVPLAGIAANTASWVWGYLIDADIPVAGVRQSYLGPVVLAKRNVETQPVYINALPYGTASKVQPLLPTDQTLDWADPLGTGCVGADIGVRTECASIYGGPQPAVPHIHGGEVAPLYDGGPDAWWTPTGDRGSGSPAASGSDRATFIYPTRQQAGTIWFHDHALGITRLNVFAGMAGLYIITDPANEPPQAGATCAATGCLPKFPEYDIPLIIQDRSFDTNGQIFYNLASNPQPNPTVHPFWIPEFIGDAIVVNGKTWPFLNVEPRKYRFRLVNGSNARFYDLTLSNGDPFTVIATDDGYLNAPVQTKNVIIAPGERYEVIVDFGKLKPGKTVIMNNSARTPFPGGGKVVKGTTDTVMQFVGVALNTAIADATLPANLRPLAILDIKAPAVTAKPVPGACPVVDYTVVPPVPYPTTSTVVRQLTLNEVIGPGGPLELVLNNTKYNGVVAGITGRNSEQPAVGDTEIWEIINITADAHPMHTHLASFQLLNRQAFNAAAWTTVYAAQLLAAGIPDGGGPPNPYLQQNTDCAIGGNPAIGPYFKGSPKPPLPYENGWKDTVITYPGEVTRIVVRWAETDAPVATTVAGVKTYPFADTELFSGVGYVWHCHIVDHEDNEMMRPYIVRPDRQAIY